MGEDELSLPECHEGPDAFERFDKAMSDFLAVPKSLILRKQRAYRKKVASNPNRPGPKRKDEQPNIDALPDEA